MGVYKKKNRWYADFYVDGKRKREVVKLKGIPPEHINRQDALKFLSIKKAEVAQGVYVELKTKPVLFEKLVSAFIDGYSKTNKKSWARDVTSCKVLSEYFGGKRLSQITPWLVDKYKSKRLKDVSRRKGTVSKATINRELACLKKMLSYAVGEKWLASNPLSGYKLFREVQNRVRFVSPVEFKKVYNQAAVTLKPILLIAYNTGMRRGEILKLKWADVDFPGRLILVTDPKNSEPRQITMNDECHSTLLSLRIEAQGEHVISLEGRPVKTFHTAFKAAVRRSGVQPFTFHDLRHTYASNLAMAGVDIATVQELLGHKSINMTKRYSHPTLEHKKRAVEKIKSAVTDTSLDTRVIDLKTKSDVSS